MKSLILFTLFTCAAQPLVDTITQFDLDLARPKEKTLTQVLDHTVTGHGRHTLETFLLHPTDSIETVHCRQQNVRFLHEHAHLGTQIQKLLSHSAQAEPALTPHLHDHLAEQALSQVYFALPQLKRFNTNPYALDVAYGAHIVGLLAPLAEHLMLHLGIDLIAHGHDHHDHHGCDHDDHSGSTLPYYGLQALHWGLHVPGLYDMAQDIRHRARMVQHIHAQTAHIASYVRSAQQIHELLEQYGTYASSFEPFSKLEYFFGQNPACSAEFQKFLTLLKKNTFTQNPSFWNHVGNVLAAYKAYINVQEEWALLTQAIGEIDVYLSFAQLIRTQTSQQPWSFVEFCASETPQLIVEDVRHLFVANSTPHSFSSEQSRTMLITGDNGSGKSTYLTSMGHALILAQTFGIVPARSCILTPFRHIYTFRFIQDNMFEGISRFYAECARIDTIITTVTESSGFSCILLDEPYTYTTHEKGSAYLQEALTKLSTLNTTISFIATHYHDLDLGNFTRKNLP